MKAHTRLDRNVVAVEVDGTVNLLIELEAPPAPATTRRPIDVTVAIDRSGSMSGRKLRSVLRAVAQLARLLTADDRLGIVTFDDEAQLVLPLGSHGVDEINQTLAGIRSGGSTNLSGGWLCGYDEMAQKGRPDAMKRIVVLTDGEANVGIVDPVLLTGIVGGGRVREITTSVIGFGDGFNEELCAGLADAGGGDDYFCEGPDHAPTVFRQEFEGLASVVAQNIIVEIVPDARTGDVELLSKFPSTRVGSTVRIDVGDAFGDEKRSVIAQIKVGAIGEPGTVKVADVQIRWVDVTGGGAAMHSTSIPVEIGAAPGADADRVAPDAGVVEQVEILLAVRARRDAIEMARKGDTAGARARLSEAKQIAMRYPSMAEELDEIERDEWEIEAGQISSSRAKNSYASEREWSRSRKKRFLAGEDPDRPVNPDDVF
jgi:Ca-activated chloride channel family protein